MKVEDVWHAKLDDSEYRVSIPAKADMRNGRLTMTVCEAYKAYLFLKKFLKKQGLIE